LFTEVLTKVEEATFLYGPKLNQFSLAKTSTSNSKSSSIKFLSYGLFEVLIFKIPALADKRQRGALVGPAINADP
jgi:hypothetical protein